MEKKKNDKSDLLQGTLDLLILKSLMMGPMHGWAISQHILTASEEMFLVKEGSLYPCLHRLERQDWIKAEWGLSENNRKAKFYKLTVAGKKRFTTETASWEKFVAAMTLVLATT